MLKYRYKPTISAEDGTGSRRPTWEMREQSPRLRGLQKGDRMKAKKRKRIKVKVVPKLDPMEIIKQGVREVILPDLTPAKNEAANYGTAEEPQQK